MREGGRNESGTDIAEEDTARGSYVYSDPVLNVYLISSF